MSYTRCRIQGYDIVHTYDIGHTISYVQNPYVVHTISYVRYTARCRIHDVRRRVTGRTISYVAYDIVGGKNPDISLRWAESAGLPDSVGLAAPGPGWSPVGIWPLSPS